MTHPIYDELTAEMAATLPADDPNIATRPDDADPIDHEALIGDILEDPAAVIADTTLAVVEPAVEQPEPGSVQR